MQAKIDNVRAMLLRHGYHPRCEQEVLEMGRAHLARGGLHGESLGRTAPHGELPSGTR